MERLDLPNDQQPNKQPKYRVVVARGDRRVVVTRESARKGKKPARLRVSRYPAPAAQDRPISAVRGTRPEEKEWKGKVFSLHGGVSPDRTSLYGEPPNAERTRGGERGDSRGMPNRRGKRGGIVRTVGVGGDWVNVG